MISYQVYKVVHIIGIILLMAGLGAAISYALAASAPGLVAPRRLIGAFHGTGAFLILLGGFGMLARLGIMQGGASFPGWLWVKLVIWALLVAALIVARRRPSLVRPVLFSLPVLGGLAAYMAIYKPF